MSYILFVNPAIAASVGMPAEAVFAATAISAALGSLALGFLANVPLAMAPGMGLNTFFAYVICGAMGFAWQEGLAIIFISGCLHLGLMSTNLRKSLVTAIPNHLKIAFGLGLGLFIAYTGLKGAGFLTFTIPFGHYEILESGTIITDSEIVPGFSGIAGGQQLVALTGLAVATVLLALEKLTGDSYAALPTAIVAAAALGLPLGVTKMVGIDFISLSSLGALKDIFMAMWGNPGLLSLFDEPHKLAAVTLTILIVFMTNVLDAVGTVMGMGQAQEVELKNTETNGDVNTLTEADGRPDRTLLVNSIGGPLAAIMGTTTCTVYMESVTGIAAGGRTGLTAVVVGILFILCLPLSGFFKLIPGPAIAPALIVAGAFMIPMASRINWKNFEESFPTFLTMLFIPLTYSFVYGIAAGMLSHVIIQVAVGKKRSVHPLLYVISFIFIIMLLSKSFIK